MKMDRISQERLALAHWVFLLQEAPEYLCTNCGEEKGVDCDCERVVICPTCGIREAGWSGECMECRFAPYGTAWQEEQDDLRYGNF